MIELTEEARLVPPEFEEREGEIVVRFRPIHYVPPRRVQRDLSNLQRNLLQILGREGAVSLSEIMEKLPEGEEAAKRTVQENLQALRQLELVKLDGHGRGAVWRLDTPANQGNDPFSVASPSVATLRKKTRAVTGKKRVFGRRSTTRFAKQ